MDNGLFRPDCTHRDHGWRFAQLSSNMCEEFICYFLVVCNVLVCRAGQLRLLFIELRSEPCIVSPIDLGGN